MTELKGSAFILRAIQAQEADLILRLLTVNGEKISVFARAALKSKKRFGGALQPFLNISFRAIQRKSHASSSDLFFLEEAQVKYEFSNLTKKMDRLWAASRVTELLDKSAHGGLENPQLYNLYGAAMKALDSGLDCEGVERQFEIKLLSVMGWLPQLGKCGECGKEERDLTLHPSTGEVLCEECGFYPLAISMPLQAQIKHFLQTSILTGNHLTGSFRELTLISSALLKSHLQ